MAVGYNNISGRLPVSIPGLYDIGSGIDKEKKLKVRQVSKYKPGVKVKRVLPNAFGVDKYYLKSLMELAVADSAWPGGVLLGQVIFLI